jgi:hypothetical protein
LILFSATALCCGSGDASGKWTTISGASNTGEKAQNADKEKAVTTSGGFRANLPADLTAPSDDVEQRLLKEYGSVFVARGGAAAPNAVVFKDTAVVTAFQNRAGSAKASIGGVNIELQPPALKALQDAAAEAGQNGLTITPNGSDAAKRSYENTVTLWASRVEPALDHWVSAGRITAADAQRIRALSPYEQVPEVLKLEDRGIYFAKSLDKSIVYSVAPPGSSQHLSMLALDVKENDNPRVREILAKHGWYQTVVSDVPHFTYLGVSQSELPGLGLKKVTSGGRTFWLPDI